MLNSGRVTASEESRMFCVRLPDPEIVSPMFWNVWLKLTELARVLWVYDNGLYMLSRFFLS